MAAHVARAPTTIDRLPVASARVAAARRIYPGGYAPEEARMHAGGLENESRMIGLRSRGRDTHKKFVNGNKH